MDSTPETPPHRSITTTTTADPEENRKVASIAMAMARRVGFGQFEIPKLSYVIVSSLLSTGLAFKLFCLGFLYFLPWLFTAEHVFMNNG